MSSKGGRREGRSSRSCRGRRDRQQPRVPANYSPASIVPYGYPPASSVPYPSPHANANGAHANANANGGVLSRAAPPRKHKHKTGTVPSMNVKVQPSIDSLKTTGPVNSTATTSEVEIAKEYITNLQQQVYFLELELDLIKKQNLCSNCKGPMSTGTPPPQGVLMRGAAPKAIDLQNNGLNGKHTTDVSSIQSVLEETRLDKTLVEEELQGVKKNFSERHANLLDDNIMLEDKVEKLQFRLSAKTADVENLQADLAKEKGSRQLATEKMRRDMSDLDNKVVRLTAELSGMAEQNRELQIQVEQAKFANGTNTADSARQLQEKIESLLQEQHRLQNEVRASELGKEQAQQAAAKADSFVQQVLQENASLKTSLLKAQGSEGGDDGQLVYTTTLVDLRNEVKNLKDQVKHSKVKLLSEKTQVENLEKCITNAKEELSLAHSRLHEKENLLSRLHAHDTASEGKAKLFKRNLMLKSEELSDVQRELERVKHALKDAVIDKKAALEKVSRLKEAAKVNEDKHKQVTESISQLMAGLGETRKL